MTPPFRFRFRFALALLGGALLLAGCNEKRVDHGAGYGRSSTPSAPAESSRSATQQAQDRAAAAAQRLQEAQQNASTDQEKEDAVKQYEAERQSIANSTDQQNSQSSPPPQ